ncbi:MAG: NmrA family NAD(P)-binding protein [Archangium sp.]|nr:NmrA family NAD(P)-binding protein [Archangium sp.]
MARVLVTGATGNVGREVVRVCSARGLTVRAAVREPSAAHAAAAETVNLDFLDRSTWAPALTGCDFVFLLRPPPLGDMKNTLCPFIEAAEGAGVRHIVFLSVEGADRMEWVPHRKVERHLLASSLSWTVLRPGFFAQNLQDAYRRDIVDDGRIYVPAAGARVAFVDSADLAEVTARVFEHPDSHRGQALTLTGSKAVSFDEVAHLLSAELGRPIRYQAASIFGYGWHLRTKRRLPLMQIIVQTVLHVGLRRGGAEQVDPTLERVLGRPARRTEQYIHDAAPLWRRRSSAAGAFV